MRNADHIAVMKAGQIAEEGSHAQLMKRRGIYYSLVRRQTGDGTLGTTEGDPQKVGNHAADHCLWMALWLLLSCFCASLKCLPATLVGDAG